MSQANTKSTEQFLNFKCKNCSCLFASMSVYDTHSRHQAAKGTLCSAESSKTEITFTFLGGLATTILRQHSLTRLGVQYQIIQIIALLSNKELTNGNPPVSAMLQLSPPLLQAQDPQGQQPQDPPPP
jgi:hypothetical protein